ncbi:roadblock/LC7 domain-containing protein [Sporobolomyces salmoneus]|uniref:roadblock/LC7 domain-containing protein n=1 Tax=Sporobolomyces salmoneus TaxID=183962 RepID=UPI00316ED065
MASTHPPEVDATLNRLTSYKNVQGVLILSRPNGIIIRSAGSLFALPPASAAAETEEDTTEGGQESGEEKAVPTTSELARNYAKAATRMVEAVGTDVRGLGEEENDDLRFLRVRTKRHELMITPHEQYLLVVVQDPTN